MNKLGMYCQRCLNPWMIGGILVIAVALLILIPILGVAALLTALPLVACTVMCGSMVFMMKKK